MPGADGAEVAGARLGPDDDVRGRGRVDARHGPREAVDLEEALARALLLVEVAHARELDVDRDALAEAQLELLADVEPLDVGEELELSFGQGVTVNVKLTGMGDLDEKKGTRECFFEVNGFPRSVTRVDTSASADVVVRPKASPGDLGSVGAPMPGVVV